MNRVVVERWGAGVSNVLPNAGGPAYWYPNSYAPPPPPGRRVPSWAIVVGVVASVFVLLIGAAIVLPAVLRLSPQTAHPVMTNAAGLPIEFGDPWGQKCARLQVYTTDLPATAEAQVEEVVAEAKAGGVPVYLNAAAPGTESFAPDYETLLLAPADLSQTFPNDNEAVLWDAPAVAGKRYARLTATSAGWDISKMESSANPELTFRQYARRDLALGFGLATNNSPSSAFHNPVPANPDSFAPADLSLMRQMDGCS